MALLVVTLLIGIVLANCLVNSLSVPTLDSMKLIHGEKWRLLKKYERHKKKNVCV